MKNLNVFIILLIFIFGYASCTKVGKNVTIKGRVINPVNNEPIAEKKVYLYKNNFKTIKRTNTNVKGEFELSAARFGPIWAEVSYDYKEYYSLGWDYEGQYYSALKVDKGEVMNVDYHMVPYGLFKLNIYNVNCIDINDSLVLNIKYELQPEKNTFGNPKFYVGCYSNEFNSQKLPIGNYILKWEVIRAGISENYNDVLFVTKNGVSEYTINY